MVVWGQGPAASDPIRAARARVEAHPDDAAALVDLGRLYYDAGQLSEALGAFRRAADVDPGTVEPLANISVVLIELGHFHEAIEALDAAQRLAPEDPFLLCQVAAARSAMGEVEASVRALLQAIAIDPGNQTAHYRLGVAFAEAGIYKEAIREWQAVLRSDETSDIAAMARRNITLARSRMSASRGGSG